MSLALEQTCVLLQQLVDVGIRCLARLVCLSRPTDEERSYVCVGALVSLSSLHLLLAVGLIIFELVEF